MRARVPMPVESRLSLRRLCAILRQAAGEVAAAAGWAGLRNFGGERDASIVR
jgi:hypothetical protein